MELYLRGTKGMCHSIAYEKFVICIDGEDFTADQIFAIAIIMQYLIPYDDKKKAGAFKVVRSEEGFIPDGTNMVMGMEDVGDFDGTVINSIRYEDGDDDMLMLAVITLLRDKYMVDIPYVLTRLSNHVFHHQDISRSSCIVSTMKELIPYDAELQEESLNVALGYARDIIDGLVNGMPGTFEQIGYYYKHLPLCKGNDIAVNAVIKHLSKLKTI